MSFLDRLLGRSTPGQATPAAPAAPAGATPRRYESPPPVTDALERHCLDALRTYLDDPTGHEFLILHAQRQRNAYVQFVALGDRLQGEVSGEAFLATPLGERQRQQRAALGWAESGSGPNPAQEWLYPVQLEVVAGTVARTLVEVFDLSPFDRPEEEMGSG